ncbi:GIY-YIG nuclease family protein [Pseudomonas syringae]|uniref:GIY-YIG nuclease family protein n=1 Tax=Pseudomonas syringae TaxID=317 RepID=UPI003D66304D
MSEEIRNWYIYILKLELNSWYVGTAKGLRSRLRSHGKKSPYSKLKRKGTLKYMESGLTGKRKATHLHAAFRSTGDCFWVTEIENTITVALGQKYGFDKVRGGSIIQRWSYELSDIEVENLIRQFSCSDIRLKYKPHEINLTQEKPFVFPITRRRNA